MVAESGDATKTAESQVVPDTESQEDHMNTPTNAPAVTRRKMLAAATGGFIGLCLSALGKAPTVRAATGDAIVAGQANAADVGTSLSISDSSSSASAFAVTAATTGTAVGGASPRGNGLLGVSGATDIAPYTGADIGVSGRADHPEAIAGVGGDSSTGVGVLGTADGVGVLGAGGVVGVLGNSFDLTGTSVYAVSSIYPLPAPLPNTALHARRAMSAGGYAAYIDGRLRLRLSGRATMTSGSSVKSISVSGLTSSMMVFAVLQSSESGTWVRAAVPAAGSLKIYLNKALTSSATVAWMVIG
jgi:hypothetical protein